MCRRSLVSAVSALALVVASIIYPIKSYSCGHDGFYMGLGYDQLLMFTTEHQLSAGSLGRIEFGPGFGAYGLIGYDFCGSRWGLQMPFEWNRFRLNKSEWVNQFGSSLEAVLHLVEWSNALDVHLIGGIGWSYLTEGPINNQTNSGGITGSLGPGLSFYFHRSEKASAALTFEVPVRVIHYFGSRLSANGTTILAIPFRIGLQIGF